MKRLALIIILLCSTLNAATYFVDNTGGSNSNNGLSTGAAWETLRYACSTLVAGDTLFIRAGTYNERWPNANTPCDHNVERGPIPWNDGTAGNEIVLKGYPGEMPILQGDNAGSTHPQAMLLFDGTAGNQYIVYDSLHFKYGDGGIMLRPYGARYLTFKWLTIDSSSMCSWDDNNGGITMYTGGYETGPPEDDTSKVQRNIVIDHCTIFGNGKQGVGEFDNNVSGIHSYCCDSCTFSNNIIHDQYNGIGLKYGARWSEIYGNTIYNTVNAMIEMFHATDATTSGPSYGGPDQVAATRWHHNLVYQSNKCLALRLRSVSGSYPDSLLYFYNNTCDCSGPYPIESGEISYGAGFYTQYGDIARTWIFNNIFYGAPPPRFSSDEDHEAAWSYGTETSSPTQLYEDYNMYYGLDADDSLFFNTHGTFRSLAQWRAASPSGLYGGAFNSGSGAGASGQQGDHSQWANPLFTNQASRDYTLQAGSPALTGGKGGTLKIFPGFPKEETINVPSYMGAFAPSGACADTLVAPTFTSPSNGATVSLNQVYLDWADSTQAGTVDTYDLQVDDNSDFGSTVFTSATAWSKDTVTTTLKPYGTYYWRVRGRSDCDTSAWSGYRTFVQGDSCIQITGKGALGSSDTCYCIVDSLLYTFAQRDTLINTNGKDNIRIWGYHTGGGRGIIGYSASDAGNLAWSTDSLKAAVVLHLSGTDHVSIKNLAIVPRTIADSVHQIVGINALTAHDVLVENCSTRTSGFSSRAFQAFTSGGSSSYNLDLYNSYFGSASKGYRRRDQMYGATIAGDGSQAKTTSGYNYFLKVHKCRVQTIHAGISNSGGGNYPVVVYDSNTISVDTRNDLYMTYTDEVNYSTADPFGISIDGCDSLSEVIGNTITAGSSYYGGDGLLIQHVNASATNQMEVYGNVMTLNHGEHPAIQSIRQYNLGIYGRNYADPYFLKGLHIHDNSIALIVDTSQATNHIGYRAEGIRLGFENGSSDNLVEKNHITIVPADSSSRTGAGSFVTNGLAINQQDSLASGQTGTGRNNVIKNNYYRVPKTPLSYSEERIGIGANNIAIVGDTINTIYDGDSTFLIFHQGGTYGGHHIGNTLQDMILQGYANLADVIKGYVSDNPDSLGKQVSYTRSLTVNFKDVSSANINGGTIWAVDAYGHRHDMPNSNASGNSSDTLRWRFFGYDAMTGDSYVVADSNGYNNFTFWGKSGSDSASTAATINWTTSQSINVQLTDYTPPAPIKTLRGITLKGVTIK